MGICNPSGLGLPFFSDHLHITGSTFVDFNRDHGGAVRLTGGTFATVVSTKFKRNAATEAGNDWDGILGSSVAVLEDAAVLLQVCSFVSHALVAFYTEQSVLSILSASGPT